MEIPVPKRRDKGFTIYGAIGNCLKESYFKDEDRTEGISFRQFIQTLKEEYVRDEFARRKPFLLLENHPSHKSIASRNLL
jgi:hypothetical protein